MRHLTALLAAGVEVTILAAERTDEWNGVPASLRPDLERRLLELDGHPPGPLSLARSLASLTGKALVSRAHRARLSALPGALRVMYRRGVIDIATGAGSQGFGAFDAIVAHFGQNAVRADNLRRAGLIRGPLAAIFHGFDVSNRDVLRRNLPRYRRLFESAEMLLPVSRYWLERLAAWGAPRHKLAVLRMGVDLPDASEIDFERPVASPLRVLSVGRFTEKKGLGYAIQGVKRSAAKATLEIVGYGELEAELLREAAAPGENPVEFLGRMPNERVLERMTTSDVVLLPSVEAENGDMEGIPVTLMEAMARGCLVLATRHSGIPELVTSGESGILVAERDAVQIADELERVARGEYDAAMLRRNARARIEREFDGARLDRELLDLVRALASERPSRGAAHPEPAAALAARS